MAEEVATERHRVRRLRSSTAKASTNIGRDVEFRILGPLEATDDTGPVNLASGKQKALLALLLLHADRVVPAAGSSTTSGARTCLRAQPRWCRSPSRCSASTCRRG